MCERFGVLPRAGGLDDQTTRLFRLFAAERAYREGVSS